MTTGTNVTSNNHNVNNLSDNTADDMSKLYQLSESWLELESDPGLFTLLISDFGCTGVEVEEIYDLATPFTDQVYGFIFLFNVVEERRNRNRGQITNSPSSLLSGEYIEDENFLNEMFFAYQKVPNSCATHAILSVLLNSKQVNLGETLTKLKNYTKDMTPENKGLAISNMPELARAHNSHAAPISNQREQLKQNTNAVRLSQRNATSAEAFHFVSFVPINGRLIELDGLKELPIDHGPIQNDEPWTEKFRKLIRQRIETPGGISHDIRYNLMAVIPSKYHLSRTHLQHMQRNRILLLKILHFFEFYSGIRILCEHNYSKYDGLETPHARYSSLPVQQQLEINVEQNSFRFVPFSDMAEESGPLSSGSVSTDTASESSSVYNYIEEDCNQIDNDDSSTQNNCKKFIVCKFEYKPDSPKELDKTKKGDSIKIEEESNRNQIDCESPKKRLEKQPKTYSKRNKNKCESRLAKNINQIDKSKTIEPCKGLLDESDIKDNDVKVSCESLLKKFQNLRDKHPRSTWSVTDFELELKPLILCDLSRLISNLNAQIEFWNKINCDEEKKKLKYSMDDSRRVHDYDALITTFLAMFSEQGLMELFVNQELCNQSTYYPISGQISTDSGISSSLTSSGSLAATSSSTTGNSKNNISSMIPHGSSLMLDNYLNGFFPSNFSFDSIQNSETNNNNHDNDDEDNDDDDDEDDDDDDDEMSTDD